MARRRTPPRNPFIIGLLAEGDHFADREAEVARMRRVFEEPGAKLVVYGDRRLGKSSAMERAAAEVRAAGGRVALASFATATGPGDAAQRVFEAVQRAVGRSWRDVLSAVAERLNASLEVTPSLEAGGLPSVKLGFGLASGASPTSLLPDVLSAVDDQMERRKRPLGIGLDEFQRIYEWGGEDAEWALREAFQRHRALSYVMAGSQRHLIEAMVSRKGRALWRQTDVLEFGPIDPPLLEGWIAEHAGKAGVRIDPDAAAAIVAAAGPRTRDVVQLARAVWDGSSHTGEADLATVIRTLEQLVTEQGALHERLWRSLGVREQQVLRAFALDPDVQILAAATLRWYDLGPKSTVQSTVSRLVEQEHLAQAGSRYVFDDPFFRRWVQVRAVPDLGVEAPPPLLASGAGGTQR